MNQCRKVQPVVDAFVDGELSTERVLQTEEHLSHCSACHERVTLSRAIHLSTRRAVHQSCQVSPSFEQRVRTALAAERAREAASRDDHFRREQLERGKPLPWRGVVPVAAAAAIALAFASSKTESKKAGAPPSMANSHQASMSIEPNEEQLIEELIRLHASSPPPEVTEPTSMAQLERRLGLPVRVEPEFYHYGARWQGGAVIPVRNQPAASLFYYLDGHRLTVYVYDPERLPLRHSRELEPRVVRDRAVFVGTKRGYSIAAIENRGVGYAIATDLDTRESAELIAAIH